MALTYDSLATTTLQLIRPDYADAIFKASNTAYYFLARGRVQFHSGGKWIETPIIYAKNSTVQSYSGYDVLTITPTEELTMARYTWKQIAGSVSISGLEGDIQNAGEPQLVDLVKKKIMVANMSMQEKFDEMICFATTAKSAKDWLGLDELVEDKTGATQGTVGLIDRASYTWWRNQYKSDGAYANLTSDMRKFYNTCSKNINTPDLIMTTSTVFEAYEDQNAGKLRLSDTKLLDVGFDNLKFKGATMMWNENIQADLMYFLTTKFLYMYLHPNRNFAMTKFVKPNNQDAQSMQILTAGNMAVTNSRFQGVMKLA